MKNIYLTISILIYSCCLFSQTQIKHDCPNFCIDCGFLASFPNKLLEKTARQYKIQKISAGRKNYTEYYFKFDKNGNLIERGHSQASTSRINCKFQYDSLNRIVQSEYSLIGCYSRLKCKEYYNYSEFGKITKILETDIRKIYEIDTKSKKLVEVREEGMRKAFYSNEVLTKIEYYKRDTAWKKGNIQKVIEINKLNMKNVIDNYEQGKYRGLYVFDEIIWAKRDFSLENIPYSETEYIDKNKLKWLFKYNDKGLRVSENLVENSLGDKLEHDAIIINYEYHE